MLRRHLRRGNERKRWCSTRYRRIQGELQCTHSRPGTGPRRLVFVGGTSGGIGKGEGGEGALIFAGSKAKLGADYVRREAGAEQAAMERGKLALVERAAKMRQMALDARASGCGFVGFGEDGFQRRFDVAIGNAAGAKFAGNAEAPLTARIGVLAGEVEGVAGIVEIILLTEARDHTVDVFFIFSA